MSPVGERTDLSVVHGRSAADADADDYAGDREALIAPTLARAIVAAVFCGYAGSALLWAIVDLEKSAGEIALVVGCLSGLLGLQYFYFCRPSTNLHSRQSYAMLAAQAGLAYLPLPVLGESWVSQPSFVAGSVLLVLPPRVAWPAYAVIVAGAGLIAYPDLRGLAYLFVKTATAGLFVYGLTRLARLVTALHEARDELAETAVTHERLRFARDLHDLLGMSLSAIALKGELALRLARGDPEGAKRELSEILGIARRALTDMRAIAGLYRESSLDEETAPLASMLADANVGLRVDLDLTELPPHTKTALSAILRESVGYVLRQRDVERCEIVLGRQGDAVTVDIANEGAGTERRAGGVDHLSAMVSRMAGDLAVETGDGRLHLHLTVPVTPMAEPSSETADEHRASVPRLATKLASGLVVAVYFGFFVQTFLRLFFLPEVPPSGELVLIFSYLLGALVLQVAYFSRPDTALRSRVSYLLLGLLAVLTCLPWAQFVPTWEGPVGFLAGSALLVLRPVLGWLVFAAVAVAVAWTQIRFGTGSPRAIGQATLITINLALITYGLTWMARTIRQLRGARQELADAVLAETRLRFARDLHDLLGLSLSAITLKSELAYRLMPVDPARARTELADVLDITRNALVDVLSVAGGDHEMSLEDECRTAESLLTAAGLDVRMDVRIDTADLSPDVSTELATVLREGVTNVLRHSKGEHCEITIRTDRDGILLRIVNDGVTKPEATNHWGRGIHNLSHRVTALHGELTAGLEHDGRFGLSARMPSCQP